MSPVRIIQSSTPGRRQKAQVKVKAQAIKFKVQLWRGCKHSTLNERFRHCFRTFQGWIEATDLLGDLPQTRYI